jgi:predicted oxidoreductase
MRTTVLPQTDLEAPNVVLGCMRIRDLDDAAVRELFDTAVGEGVTMFDHADIYGGDHGCETRFGDALRLTGAERDGVILQSKVGIRQGFYDFSREHILASVEASLTALRTDRLDALLLHRPDALVEPEEVAAAFDELHGAGKVRHFGVSNHTPGQLEVLKQHVRQPLIANQVQFSIAHSQLVGSGLAANTLEDQTTGRDHGILDHARLTGVTLQAWSPMQSARHGVFVGDREHYAELNDLLDELAAAHGVTPTGIATAWITRHPAGMQVILGTTKASRVQEAAAGAEVRLTREEWYRLFTAAGHTVP